MPRVAQAFLGYDCISKEQSAPDAKPARFIVGLVEAGFGGQVCLSGDPSRRRYLVSWGGGPGYRYFLESFVPRLRGAGVSSKEAARLVTENPPRFLSWRAPP